VPPSIVSPQRRPGRRYAERIRKKMSERATAAAAAAAAGANVTQMTTSARQMALMSMSTTRGNRGSAAEWLANLLHTSALIGANAGKWTAQAAQRIEVKDRRVCFKRSAAPSIRHN
jgi:hypothetical protein